jgi:hypothetical protein
MQRPRTWTGGGGKRRLWDKWVKQLQEAMGEIVHFAVEEQGDFEGHIPWSTNTVIQIINLEHELAVSQTSHGDSEGEKRANGNSNHGEGCEPKTLLNQSNMPLGCGYEIVQNLRASWEIEDEGHLHQNYEILEDIHSATSYALSQPRRPKGEAILAYHL